MQLEQLGEAITDEQAEQYGESLMALMQASGELGTVYDEERQKLPQENLPAYEALCARLVFV
jgi:hypothetical protein